jgi:hypothetical protein
MKTNKLFLSMIMFIIICSVMSCVKEDLAIFDVTPMDTTKVYVTNNYYYDTTIIINNFGIVDIHYLDSTETSPCETRGGVVMTDAKGNTYYVCNGKTGETGQEGTRLIFKTEYFDEGCYVLWFFDNDRDKKINEEVDEYFETVTLLNGIKGDAGENGKDAPAISATVKLINDNTCGTGKAVLFETFANGEFLSGVQYCTPSNGQSIKPEVITSKYESTTSDSTGTMYVWFIVENTDTVVLTKDIIWNALSYNCLVAYEQIFHNVSGEPIGETRIVYLDKNRDKDFDQGIDELIDETEFMWNRAYFKKTETPTTFELEYGIAIGYSYVKQGTISIPKTTSIQKIIDGNSLTIIFYVNNNAIEGYQENSTDVHIKTISFSNVQSCEVVTESVFVDFNGCKVDYQNQGFIFNGFNLSGGRMYAKGSASLQTSHFSNLFSNPEMLVGVSCIVGSSKAFTFKVKAVKNNQIISEKSVPIAANPSFNYANKETYKQVNLSFDNVKADFLILEVIASTTKCDNSEFMVDDVNIIVGQENCSSDFHFE